MHDSAPELQTLMIMTPLQAALVRHQEDPLEEEMATHSSILDWKIPQRSLTGYSSWGHKESDTTEHTRPLP